jgi:pilus assembly protein TadC
MITAVAAAAAGASVLAAGRRPALGRLTVLRAGAAPPLMTSTVVRGQSRQRAAIGLLAAGSAALAPVGGALTRVGAGLLAGVAVAVLLHRLDLSARRRETALLEAELPLGLELVAGCLHAGVPLEAAVSAACSALGGRFAATLAPVAAALTIGAAPADAWLELAADPVLGPVARALSRAARTGEPVADALDRLAADRRRAHRAAGAAAARRAGVSAVAPLGACFLPAFVLIAVVPVVAGLARTLSR